MHYFVFLWVISGWAGVLSHMVCVSVMRNLRDSACKLWRTLSGERSGSSRLQGRIASLPNASAGHLALTWNFPFITCLLDRKTSLVPLKRTHVLPYFSPCGRLFVFVVFIKWETDDFWSVSTPVLPYDRLFTALVEGFQRNQQEWMLKESLWCAKWTFLGDGGYLELLGIPQVMKKEWKRIWILYFCWIGHSSLVFGGKHIVFRPQNVRHHRYFLWGISVIKCV